jgi:hypothetical protein
MSVDIERHFPVLLPMGVDQSTSKKYAFSSQDAPWQHA